MPKERDENVELSNIEHVKQKKSKLKWFLSLYTRWMLYESHFLKLKDSMCVRSLSFSILPFSFTEALSKRRGKSLKVSTIERKWRLSLYKTIPSLFFNEKSLSKLRLCNNFCCSCRNFSISIHIIKHLHIIDEMKLL